MVRKKLLNMKMKDIGSMKDYVRQMTETFDELAALGDPLDEADKVQYLLGGLPESYDALVTVLEGTTGNLPAMEVVTEHLLRGGVCERNLMKEVTIGRH